MLPTQLASKNLLGLASRQAPKVAASAAPARAFSSSSPAQQDATLLQDKNGFGFARSNPRPAKPRSKGVTEIRGPYYTVCMAIAKERVCANIA